MKKYIIKLLGLLFLVLGTFIIIIQPFTPITSAVIDLSTNTSKISFGIGSIIVIIGIVILIRSQNKYQTNKKTKKKK